MQALPLPMGRGRVFSMPLRGLLARIHARPLAAPQAHQDGRGGPHPIYFMRFSGCGLEGRVGVYTLTWQGPKKALKIAVYGAPPAGFLLEDVLREARQAGSEGLDVEFDLRQADASVLEEITAIREALATPCARAA